MIVCFSHLFFSFALMVLFLYVPIFYRFKFSERFSDIMGCFGTCYPFHTPFQILVPPFPGDGFWKLTISTSEISGELANPCSLSSFCLKISSCTLNGLMIHKKTFNKVGKFEEEENLQMCKLLWGCKAAEYGCKFKAILGYQIF